MQEWIGIDISISDLTVDIFPFLVILTEPHGHFLDYVTLLLTVSSHDTTLPVMTIRGDLSLGSDHKLIHFTFRNQPRLQQPLNTYQRRLWHLKKLDDQDTFNHYLDSFATHTQHLESDLANLTATISPQSPPTSQTTIDCLNDHLTSAIYRALDDSTGQITPQFWTDEMQLAMERREFCYQKWRNLLFSLSLSKKLDFSVSITVLIHDTTSTMTFSEQDLKEKKEDIYTNSSPHGGSREGEDKGEDNGEDNGEQKKH
ncbi:hypothetical protein [Absidia glauca]|uniref:Uncharacterized protein n=1 Tax=Absidia glauca TaxID=4829 RepID=A0A168L3C0_ABSGL|nr:hypothetical protein [Absidia glauca]